MKGTMTEAGAFNILKQLAHMHDRWGKNMSPPYTAHQLYEAIALAAAKGAFEEPEPVVAKEEVTLLRRQLAACQNREKARKGALNGPNEALGTLEAAE